MQLTEVNAKWTPSNLDIIKSKMKKLGRETTMHVVGNSTKIKEAKDYLPGGVATIIRRKSV